MGKTYDHITESLQAWIEQQRMFFVATAPLSERGHVNCSPKGMDTFRILGPCSVGYVDYVGSGIETVAHLKENGRIVIMFCAFEGPPQILRLHGRGRTLQPDTPGFEMLETSFPECHGMRSIIQVDVTRVSTSCGWGVPLYDFKGERDDLQNWADKQDAESLTDYQRRKNVTSIDNLPGLQI